MDARRYQIGELARISGVAAKTIRFYSDSGILPPTAMTAAGYRLYSEADRGRLETIRALRELGFPLPTIATLLDQGERVAATALRAQLAALEATERTIRRQRVVLRAALHKGESATLAYLDHAHAHARLGLIERQKLLDDYLARVFDGVAADEGWKAGFAQAATLDLPEELSDAQFAAWLELADLITDADFIARLNAIGQAAWGGVEAPHRPPPLHDLYAAADAARRGGHTPDDAVGRGVIDDYLAREAAARGRDATDPALPGDVLADIARGDEPRAARYWELIAILKGWPPSPIPEAHRWLVAGLQLRAGRGTAPSRPKGRQTPSARPHRWPPNARADNEHHEDRSSQTMTALTAAQRAFLDRPLHAIVATLDPEGQPSQSVVWYVREGDGLWISVGPESVKARHLRRDPRVSVLVLSEDGSAYLRLEGTATFDGTVDDAARAMLVGRYVGAGRAVDWLAAHPLPSPNTRLRIAATRVGAHNLD